VTTPLLDAPLKGAIFLRSSQNELPDMALDLEGQIHIEAVGRIDSVNGRLRTTFDAIPDIPVSQIKFDLEGGSKGLLVNSQGLCGTSKSATVRMTAHSGSSRSTRSKLEVACGSKSRTKRQESHRQREVR
jgi:hypothetical protein